jgi:hypothetical protein
MTPAVVELVDDLNRAGFSEPSSLSIVAKIWRPISINDNTKFTELRELIYCTLEELHRTGRVTTIDEAAYNRIAMRWPFPLYGIEMRQIPVNKSKLREFQARWYPEM